LIQFSSFKKCAVQQQCDFSMWAQRRVALVVAHPDDEAMFFTPTIASLRAQQCAIFVLCLSTGNFYGLGATRRREMQASCSDVLGVDHCTVLDDRAFARRRRHAVARGGGCRLR
jgi:LmbE family N-acetylglucosaminyl deacetylase